MSSPKDRNRPTVRFIIGRDLKCKDLLKDLARKKETGVVKISVKKGKPGEIFFKKGKPVHAVYGVYEGVEAVQALVRVEYADAVFEPDKKTVTTTIAKGLGVYELVEQRRMRIDEILKRLPGFETVLAKAGELPRTDGFALRTTDWQVLVLFDGRRTLREVIDGSPLGEEATLQAIDWLIEAGLIVNPAEADDTERP